MSSPEISQRLQDALMRLCLVDSPTGEEALLCDEQQAYLSKLPLAAPIRRYGNSLVVPLSRNTGGPHIALVGHLDTVRAENGPARIEGDRFFASGAADMKSGLAVMDVLAENFSTWPTSVAGVDLTLVYYAREEGPFTENELGPVLAADAEVRGVDFAVCLEPSDNRLQLGCCGSLHATLTFVGKTGHSARPWEGVNAITSAGAFLAELHALAPEVVTLDGYMYQSVFTVTQAKDGGRSRNVVPDAFVLNLNHRFAPNVSLEQAQENVRRLLRDRAEIAFTDLSPGALPNGKHACVDALRRAGVSVVMPKQAWTDVARFSALGIAAVNFGPGENAQAHQRNESTSLRLLSKSYDIFERWIAALSKR
jgi:succinyl-diaminopimelate desuccinylase